MNTNETLEQLKALKLMGMVASYHSQLELPLHQQLESHELLAHLVQTETLHRSNEKTTAYVKGARLRLSATLEEVECSPARGLFNSSSICFVFSCTCKALSLGVYSGVQ